MEPISMLCVLVLLIWPRCAEGALHFSCDFGTSTNETLCGMVHVMDSNHGNFEWKLTSDSGKSTTGPTEDHTGNTGGTGRFLWADSSVGHSGAKATISTPPFNLTGGQGWLTFYYHIYGGDVGDLKISVCKGGDIVLTLGGDQRNRWHEQNLTVSCGNNSTQITFTALMNGEGNSDMAIDDILFYEQLMNTAFTTNESPTSTPRDNDTFQSEFTTVMTVDTGKPSSGPVTKVTSQIWTSPSPLLEKEQDLALPVSLSVVAVFFVAVLIILVCFFMKRRQQPEKPIPQESAHRYDNHAYSTEMKEVRDNTTDTRRNTNSTFDSSTWRSEFSTMNGTGANGTLGGSQPPNRSSQASCGSGSRHSGAAPSPESRHYFVLNPGRASMLVQDEEGEVRNHYDPVALYDNKPERYTYIENENEGSSTATATGDAAGEMGMDSSGYDPVTIKDDITGGYQLLDGTGTAMANGATDYTELRSPYEPITVQEKPSKSAKTKASDRKTPIPAARKNVPPQPKERMVDNVLYKPMNGERMVDNVLYNQFQEGK